MFAITILRDARIFLKSGLTIAIWFIFSTNKSLHTVNPIGLFSCQGSILLLFTSLARRTSQMLFHGVQTIKRGWTLKMNSVYSSIQNISQFAQFTWQHSQSKEIPLYANVSSQFKNMTKKS